MGRSNPTKEDVLREIKNTKEDIKRCVKEYGEDSPTIPTYKVYLKLMQDRLKEKDYN